MENTKERFGVEPMTFEEEMELWDEHPSKAQTRNNKRRMVIALEGIEYFAKYCTNYVKSIPEEDDEKHAKRVAELTEMMERTNMLLYSEFDRIVYNR